MKIVRILISLCVFFSLTLSRLVAQEVAFHSIETIENILVDTTGNLYLQTPVSICAFNGQNLNDDCIILNRPADFCCAVSGTTFIVATGKSFSLFERGTIAYEKEFPELITCVANDGDFVYFGTAGNGVFRFNIETYVVEHFGQLRTSFINGISILQSQLILALDDGVAITDVSFNKDLRKSTLQNQIVQFVTPFSESSFLALDYANSVFEVDKNGAVLRQDGLNISRVKNVSAYSGSVTLMTDSTVYMLTESLNALPLFEGEYDAIQTHQNLIFFVSDNRLYKYDVTQKIYTESRYNYALVADEEELWVGGKGIIRLYDKGVLKKVINLQSQIKGINVSTISVSETHIFAGTMGEGIFVFNRSNYALEKHWKSDQEVNRNNIIQMHDHEGVLFVAHLTGVFLFDKTKMEVVRDYPGLLDDQYVFCVFPIDPDHFFIGTSNSGVQYYHNDTTYSILKGRTVYNISGNKDCLYAGTQKSGLFRIKYPTEKERMEVSLVFEMKNILNNIDLDSHILLAGEDEIQIYNKASRVKYELPSLELTNLNINASARDNNAIYLGFENGIGFYDVERLKALGGMQVQIVQLDVNNTMNNMSEKVFAYDENTLSFQFESSSIYQPQNTYFKYRLMGLDESWQTSRQNKVTYYGLGAGEYTFEIATGIGVDFEPVHTKQYSFEIKPAFWNTYWFWIMLGVIFIIFIGWFIRRRENQVILREKRTSDQLKFEFDRLKDQIDPHFLFNSLNSLIGQIEEDPELAVQSAEELSSLYRDILQFRDTEKIPLVKELEMAQRYFHVHKLRYGDRINLSLDELNKEGFLIPMSVQYLIENAVKHNVISKNNTLRIEIYREENYLVIANNKTKAKESIQARSGLGLINLSKRYAYISSQPVVILDETKTFKVKLPIVYD